MYLFDISTSGNPFTADPSLMAVVEFRSLKEVSDGETAMSFIALNIDYLSPFRHMPADKRREKLIKDLFGGNSTDVLKTEEYTEAETMYKGLQYNAIIEASNLYQLKLSEFNDLIKAAHPTLDDYGKLQKIMVDQSKMIELAEKMQKKAQTIFEETKDSRVKGGYTLSRIEDSIKRIHEEIRAQKVKANG